METPPLDIGFSNIHKGGWGTFARTKIPKDTFLGEYCGEVIPETEANRRGIIYDLFNMSFLFDICKGYVVDSSRSGTKMKWINHLPEFDSSDEEEEEEKDTMNYANCRSVITSVRGDPHICLFSKRDILPGEELCFDYNHGSQRGATVPNFYRQKH